MSELVILSKKEVEKMFKDFLEEIRSVKIESRDCGEGDKMNQKQAAKYLGVTEATLIRWKKNGRVPCDQLPGSTKITYYKSQLKSAFQRNSDILK
jgi:DNA-binding transcriptional regulator YiaG